MREYQRQALTEDVARVLDRPAPHAGLLELRRITWGATHDELIEIVANLDHHAAAAYEREYGASV